MPAPQDYVPIPGSHRTVRSGARATGLTNPNERIEVTVRVRNKPSSKGLPSAEEMGARRPQQRQYLSREEFETTYGADPADLAKIEAFAREHGLTVVEVSASRRSVILSGTAQALSAAFQVKLMQYEYTGGTYRGRIGPVHVPTELLPIVEGVFGLDNRPQARPHIVLPGTGRVTRDVIPPISYTPLQVAQLYNFPPELDGAGQCIGILEFGGGYSTDDLDVYFRQLALPRPQVTAVSVDRVENRPGNDPQADGEVMLDIEIAGAVAPGAQMVVYFAPFTERGWVDVLTTAIHDSQHKPSVISISWGITEGRYIWTDQAIQAVNQALQEAALMGVTVCCASGDDGSNDQANDGYAHVDFPASSPYVLACGGTHLESAHNTISSEIVWNDGPRAQGGASGGGISDVFPLPTWQVNGNVPTSVNPDRHVGRGVPDVAGNGDGSTGYSIRVDEQDINGIGGTSAVAPLWAGLIACINQKLGTPLGYFNPLLYTMLAVTPGVFHDITDGNNNTALIGGYSASKGWDACTGWGSPDGTALLKAI